ncbi:carnosine N-methyltransferase isoform X2 [Parasteatoda tepidariorum]|uniref:carnosine N-methyltransferase isoform X2 n=1 Tax=Parasteatoda tepidariorum TaxID=114398 RepID=UPI001C729526|nr:carnosine N-methyltransferase isoform X2 [Parasteatoda tepidariorum]
MDLSRKTFPVNMITNSLPCDGNEIMDVQQNDSERQESQYDDDELERKHFQRVVNAFRSYKIHSMKRLYRSTKYISSLSTHHQDLLKGYRSHLDKVRLAIEHNSEIIKVIIKDVAHLFQNADHTDDIKVVSSEVTAFDMEKIQSILKQLYREWSVEAKEERDASFKPIIDEVIALFPCENLVCQGTDLYKIYPWVHQYFNNLKSDDQVQMVRFPDVNPCDIPSKLDFSMAAGSFIEIYKESDAWDCIATCFFLDTANNIIDYIETTWNILKPGGYWINLGPLLYHHADMPDEDSIEPSYEEIRYIILKFGFVLLKEELNLVTPYSQNPRSMMSYEYKSVFFVCQKPESACRKQECS